MIVKTVKPLDLTANERRLIIVTWHAISGELTRKGLRVFDEIMKSPEIKALFPFKHVPAERLRKVPLYREHASRIIECVAAVVDELEGLGDGASTPSQTEVATLKIGILLYSLGQAHGCMHGVSPAFFRTIAHTHIIRALMTVWRQDIGAMWGPTVELAWAKLFRFMTHQLYNGLIFNASLAKDRGCQGRHFAGDHSNQQPHQPR